MARARNIKPSFFQNEQLAELEPLERLFFIGLWTVADFRGCVEFRAKRLKVQLLPYDECCVEKIAINLERSGLIASYSVQGQPYIKILNFVKHQNPHKNEREAGSTIPDIEANDNSFEEKRNDFRELGRFRTKTEKIGTNRDQNGTARADSLLLIPDSLLLNPSTPETGKATATPPQTKPDYPDWFLKIWELYPTRAGSNDKRKAYQAANARAKEGRTPAELFAAVERYKFFVVATGKVSTEYVQQGATFFGKGGHIDNPWTVPNYSGGSTPPRTPAGHVPTTQAIDYHAGINPDGSF